MTEEPPIACSLDADDLASWLRLVAEVGAAHLISEGEALVLTIEAPAEGAPVAAQLASAFAAA